MIEVWDRHGRRFRGRSVETIARREFGRSAIVRYGERVGDLREMMVVTPYDVGTFSVCATWFALDEDVRR